MTNIKAQIEEEQDESIVDYDDRWKEGDKCRVYEPNGSNWVEGTIVKLLGDYEIMVKIKTSDGRYDTLRLDYTRISPLEELGPEYSEGTDKRNFDYTEKVSAQLKESQMEKEVPVKIAPVDEKALEKGKVEEKKPGLENAQPIVGGEEAGVSSESAVSEDNAARLENVRSDTEDLKASLKDILNSSYRMVLTETQLKELTSKVLAVIASAVTDITVERVEEIAGEILHVDKDVK